MSDTEITRRAAIFGGEHMNIAVIDIGSPSKDNIGWAIVGSHERSGKNLAALISALAGALRAAPLALGFEAPMFVPMRERAMELMRARNGERDRAFSAHAGPTSHAVRPSRPCAGNLDPPHRSTPL